MSTKQSDAYKPRRNDSSESEESVEEVQENDRAIIEQEYESLPFRPACSQSMMKLISLPAVDDTDEANEHEHTFYVTLPKLAYALLKEGEYIVTRNMVTYTFIFRLKGTVRETLDQMTAKFEQYQNKLTKLITDHQKGQYPVIRVISCNTLFG